MPRILAEQTSALLNSDPERMACLQAAHALQLPDWYIVAGFVRNLVWDHIGGAAVRTRLTDVDVAYYDPKDLSIEAEFRIVRQLSERFPHVRWDAKSQARMHLRNGHPQYQSALDAISFYPELQTCVGVRLESNDEMTFAAPFGLEHNWDRAVAINRKANYPLGVAAERMLGKRWLETWPLLRVDGDDLKLAIQKFAQAYRSY